MTNSNNQRIISSKRIKDLKIILEKIKIPPAQYNSQSKQIDTFWLIIDEALTHTSAKLNWNHERLEFLGDAVLRLAASEFIDDYFPSMKVGERSALRAHLVSDNWLTEVGEDIGIKEIVIMGSKAAGDTYASATIQAEGTEALIGAIFECFKETEFIKKWLTPYWENTTKKVLNDPHKKNPKSALQEWSQAKHQQLPKYKTNQKSSTHGDPQRFLSEVELEGHKIGEGWGRSIQESEKKAAEIALANIKKYKLLSSNI